MFYLRARRWDEAERELHLAVSKYDQIGEKVGAASCQADVAVLQLGRGQFQDARTTAHTSLAMARAVGSPANEACSLALIGDAAHHPGAENAAGFWEQALTFYDELGVPEVDEVRAKLQAVRNV